MGAAIITAAGMAIIVLIERVFDNRRLRQQVQSDREREHRDRRQKLKDEPLLDLRRELARMASKHEKLVSTTKMLHTAIPAPPKEELDQWIKEALDELNDYMNSGEFGQALFTIDDQEIAAKVHELHKEYRMAFYRNTNFSDLPPEEMKKTLTQEEELAQKVREVQGMINRRLEGL